ncbi:MAG: hypothetical protein K6T85_13605, partial [Gorillibacterium sp.]|nr:hypothetical protein [Gorillibacterium sp.]
LALCAYENWFFNSTRLIDLLGRMPGAQIAIYSGFMHNEMNTLHNSKALMQRLIRLKRERFPRWLVFTPTDPCFVKSHWLQIKRLAKPGELTRVQADILTPEMIEIETMNIDSLLIVLSRQDLELEPNVTLMVNGCAHHVMLSDYTRIELATSEHLSTLTMTESLSQKTFEHWYNDVIVDVQQMGIKQLYMSRCAVVKPTVRGGFVTKLTYLLQNPIRDRYIFYRYELCQEADLELSETGDRNLVLIMDARAKSSLQQQLLADIGLTADAYHIIWSGECFEGDYFALISCPHPSFPERLILIAIYNGDQLDNEYISLMNSFDSNPLFYNDALIYHQGSFHTFRVGGEAPAIIGGVR